MLVYVCTFLFNLILNITSNIIQCEKLRKLKKLTDLTCNEIDANVRVGYCVWATVDRTLLTLLVAN